MHPLKNEQGSINTHDRNNHKEPEDNKTFRAAGRSTIAAQFQIRKTPADFIYGFRIGFFGNQGNQGHDNEREKEYYRCPVIETVVIRKRGNLENYSIDDFV